MTSTVRVVALKKRFGQKLALNNIDTEFHSGKITALAGPNGAGKTTLLRIIAGLTRPTSGDVSIGGTTYRQLSSPMSTIGIMLGSTGFYSGCSARQHLEIVCALTGIQSDQIGKMLEGVGLADNRARIKTYSAGMMQRLRLATVLLHDPPILLLDEPTNSLDPESMLQLRSVLRVGADHGKTIVIASHQLSDFYSLVDHIVVLKDGLIVEDASVAETTLGALPITRVVSAQVEQLLNAVRLVGGMAELRGQSCVEVKMTASEVAQIAQKGGVEYTSLLEVANPLERAYLELIRR